MYVIMVESSCVVCVYIYIYINWLKTNLLKEKREQRGGTPLREKKKIKKQNKSQLNQKLKSIVGVWLRIW